MKRILSGWSIVLGLLSLMHLQQATAVLVEQTGPGGSVQSINRSYATGSPATEDVLGKVAFTAEASGVVTTYTQITSSVAGTGIGQMLINVKTASGLINIAQFTATGLTLPAGMKYSGDGSLLTGLNMGAISSGVLSFPNGGTGNGATYSSGSIPFSNGSALTQDNSNLYWDNTNKRLGIGTSSAETKLHVNGNGTFEDRLRVLGGNSGAGSAIDMWDQDGSTDIYGVDVVDSTYDNLRLRFFGTSNQGLQFYDTRTASAIGALTETGLGIGTTAPSQRLEAAGIIKSSGSGNSLMFADRTTPANTWEWYSTGNTAGLYKNHNGASTVMTVDSAGAVSFGGGANINNNGLADTDLKLLVHFDATTAIGCQNWIDGLSPTVNGAPASAGIVADGNGRASLGNCLTFDGSNDNLNFGDNYDAGTGSLTLAVWFKSTASTEQNIIGKRNDYYETDDGYELGITSSGNIRYFFGDGAASSSGMTSGVDYSDGNWHHACVSIQRGTSATLYLDGKSGGTFSVANVTGDNNAGTNLYIGGGSTGGTFVPFNGQADEAMIFHRALTASEVRALYSQGAEFINKTALQKVVVEAYRSGALSIANNTLTVLVFNGETDDKTKSFNPATGVFTAPLAGSYLVTSSAYWGANATGLRSSGIYVNGTLKKLGIFTTGDNATNNFTSSCVTSTVNLAANDTLDIRVLQNSGASISISGSSDTDTFISIVRVGP
jgi:hypothetical protein